ncbi:ArsR/SmtB family transcription factor [Kribbella sp. NPDC004875]|uniref:ArsR/SmtB family transcription factor n=1 Tax=Kribbella sp. NPDC004875 TaxID=3364107 RepID=UPI00369621CA
MSKQEIALTPVAVGGCCAPISDVALDEAGAAEGASVFKALADPIRLRLFSIITSAGGEICVCDLTPRFDVSGPTISHHLKVLRAAGLVDCERRGTWVYYWPVPEKLRWVTGLLAVPDPAPTR